MADKKDMTQLLGEINFFSNLDSETLKVLQKKLKLVEFKKGKILCHQNEPGDRMFIIKSGLVSVLKLDENNIPVEITTLKPGEVTGEMSLVGQMKRSATLEAIEDTTVWALDYPVFQNLLETHPSLANALLKVFSKHLHRSGSTIAKLLSKDRPKICVVLSCGSIKALASLALFEFLDEEKINIDLLIGSSGGGLYSGLRAAGFDNQQIINATEEVAKSNPLSKIDYRTLLGIANLPFGHFDISKGLLKRNTALKACQRIFGDRKLETLHPTTLLQATDIQTGEGVVLSHGRLAEAVYATAAYYPLLPPICIEGRWLIDGGYTSVLPVMEAVKNQADVVIAMFFHEKLNAEPKHFMEGFHNMIRTFSLSLVKSQLALSIDFHHHEIIVIDVMFDKSIPLTGAAYISECLDTGRRAVDLKKDEILTAIAQYSNNRT